MQASQTMRAHTRRDVSVQCHNCLHCAPPHAQLHHWYMHGAAGSKITNIGGRLKRIVCMMQRHTKGPDVLCGCHFQLLP